MNGGILGEDCVQTGQEGEAVDPGVSRCGVRGVILGDRSSGEG